MREESGESYDEGSFHKLFFILAGKPQGTLYIKGEAVVGHVNVRGKGGFFLCLRHDVVGHMDDIGLRKAERTREFDSLLNGLMGRMVVMTKSVYHQLFDSLKQPTVLIGDGFHIRHIAQFTDAEAEDGQFAVHHPQRQHLHLADTKRLMRLDFLQIDGGNGAV